MATTTDPRLPFGEDDPAGDADVLERDAAARARAVDPRFNVALEASAGTGKTKVLVDRYVNLLRAGVDPSNVLAVTFTRKAAAEMRERIMSSLRAAAAEGQLPAARWRELRDRTGDIAVSTIDAFCLSLLREFPLEADLDPAFGVADETELPRIVDEALDGALRTCRAAARTDEDMALVFAHLGERRARAGLGVLLDRRLVGPAVLARAVGRLAPGWDAAAAARQAAASFLQLLDGMRGGLDAFLGSGPLEPAFELFGRRVRQLAADAAEGRVSPGSVPVVFQGARTHFLTQDGRPRSRSPYPQSAFASRADWQRHGALVVAHGDAFARIDAAYRRELQRLSARGLLRMFRIVETQYRRALDARAVLDFPELLVRALDLLRRMEEFSQSRYRLESRFHHVLVDEFQDTSRAQWELIWLLIQSWGEGAGLATAGPLTPSAFIVGDRKQSIYGFRDADASILAEAARRLATLRPDGNVRRSIARSFRARPALLSFVNDVCQEMDAGQGASAFRYEPADRFPVDPVGTGRDDALGLVLGPDAQACATAVAAEIRRLLAEGVSIRDRQSGLSRPIAPGDVAILFRSRDSHRDVESALAARGVPSYVYKGLGFFDADEIKDVFALVRYLADPVSDLRAAAILRSRFFRVSDAALRLLAPRIADALLGGVAPAAASLGPTDAAALAAARESTAAWRALADRVGPAELLDRALTESAYAVELRGARLAQARENLKKMRALLRRLQNHGYATIGRVADHLDRIAVGDESNATLDAAAAVSLMTVHAAKGLEFPVVFLVNLTRGTGGRRSVVRWTTEPSAEAAPVAVGDGDPEVDEAREAGEREETKRLTYVALTRARDRLYLATPLTDGRAVPARGSLAEVLPPSLVRTFVEGAGDDARWCAASGTVHRFVLCTAAPAAAGGADALTHVPPRPSDYVPISEWSTSPAAGACVAARVRSAPSASGALSDRDDAPERVIGVLVHRLIERFGLSAPADLDVERVLHLLPPPDRLAGLEAPGEDIALAALDAYRAISSRSDVRALYDAGEPLHEVPFVARIDGLLTRGTIDCLVRTSNDRLVVLEFKTGRPHESHAAQLELYRRAAQVLFPGAVVDARLVYPDGRVA